MIPNPWLILGVILALAGSWVAGDIHGHRREADSWRLQMADARGKAQADKEAQEARYSALKDKTEKDHADAIAKIDAAYSRGLSAGRLRDKGGTCKPVPSDPAPASSAPAPPSGCVLSEAASRFLWDLARDADIAAAYAKAGHDYAVGLPRY